MLTQNKNLTTIIVNFFCHLIFHWFILVKYLNMIKPDQVVIGVLDISEVNHE